MRSVVAGVASVVCSYNLANGMHASEKNHAMNSVLKNEPRIQEFVIPQESVLYSCTQSKFSITQPDRTHISLTLTLVLPAVRKVSKSVRGPVFYHTTWPCFSLRTSDRYLARHTPSTNVQPGRWLRRRMAAFNTRISGSLRRPIQYRCHRWKSVHASYRTLKIQHFVVEDLGCVVAIRALSLILRCVRLFFIV